MDSISRMRTALHVVGTMVLLSPGRSVCVGVVILCSDNISHCKNTSTITPTFACCRSRNLVFSFCLFTLLAFSTVGRIYYNVYGRWFHCISDLQINSLGRIKYPMATRACKLFLFFLVVINVNGGSLVKTFI